MSEQAFTYTELAEALGISVEAARQRAARKRWPKRMGNDGKARIVLQPDDLEMARTTVRRPANDKPERPANDHLDNPENESAIKALQDHISSLKEAVTKAEALADKRGLELEAERARVHELHMALLQAMADRERGMLSKMRQLFTGS